MENVYEAYWKIGVVFEADLTCRNIYRISKRYIKGKLLDIGAGTGALVKLLKDRGHDAIGLDQFCASPGEIVIGDARNLPFGDGTFGTVFMTDVIEHLSSEDLSKALAEAHRVLQPGGFIVLITPDDENLERNTVVCPKCRAVFHKVGHLQKFTRRTLSHLVGLAGFTPVKVNVRAFGVSRKIPLVGRFMTGWPWTRMVKWMGFQNSLIVVAEKMAAG